MLTYTLLGDGRSDKTLMKIINWSLNKLIPTIPLSESFADFKFLRRPPKTLEDKILKALELYPCDILFIHRDAETNKDIEKIIEKRKEEINDAAKNKDLKYVSIITVKMMETWLLTDSSAILKAAGNPNSRVNLSLPKVSQLETLNDPKDMLHTFLKTASELKGRRLASFNVDQAVHLVAEYTSNFSNLQNLSAYQHFENDLKSILNR